MKIETRDVTTSTLEYRDYLCSDGSLVSMTEWSNGEGFDVAWHHQGQYRHVSLSHADIDAFFALYAAGRVAVPK